MSNQYDFKTLIGKYKDGQCSEEEKIVIESWLASELQKDLLSPSVLEIEAADVRMREVIDKHTLIRQSNSSPLWPRLVAAASILIFIGIGFYLYQKNQTATNEITAKNDIAPGSNKAFLTLADGKRLILTGARNGEIASQAGVKITKTADGQLVYRISNETGIDNNVKDYNTIETPNGGQYQVILPDGSKVWLNAASSLKFPSTFARLVNRKVELLRGEAYFEVAKDKEHPFVVQTDKQEVKVLGTHFNVNAYGDEPFTKTTLLEGSVQVSMINLSDRKILKPNQQAVLTGNGFRIAEVDAAEMVLWKNGKFSFNNENMESIMRQVSRWYNVEVTYEDPVQEVKVTGSVSRFANISKLLEKLEQTGLVHFKIEGQKLIVSK